MNFPVLSTVPCPVIAECQWLQITGYLYHLPVKKGQWGKNLKILLHYKQANAKVGWNKIPVSSPIWLSFPCQ